LCGSLFREAGILAWASEFSFAIQSYREEISGSLGLDYDSKKGRSFAGAGGAREARQGNGKRISGLVNYDKGLFRHFAFATRAVRGPAHDVFGIRVVGVHDCVQNVVERHIRAFGAAVAASDPARCLCNYSFVNENDVRIVQRRGHRVDVPAGFSFAPDERVFQDGIVTVRTNRRIRHYELGHGMVYAENLNQDVSKRSGDCQAAVLASGYAILNFSH
jgi:hypothetical protein